MNLSAGCVCPSGNELKLVSDVGVFLDWRYRYSNGVLDQFAHSDVTEFLLERRPRKVARSGEAVENCATRCVSTSTSWQTPDVGPAVSIAPPA